MSKHRPKSRAKSANGPLTIVHTEASRGWGGQEIRILKEGEWMRARQHRVVFLLPSQAQLYEPVRDAGFEVHDVGFHGATHLIAIGEK